MRLVGWHHRLNGHEFEQTWGESEVQGSLACCSPWGHTKSQTQLSERTTTATTLVRGLPLPGKRVLVVKNPRANEGDTGDSNLIPGSEDPLEEDMATHSSILAWKIPRAKEPPGAPFTGSQRTGHD